MSAFVDLPGVANPLEDDWWLLEECASGLVMRVGSRKMSEQTKSSLCDNWGDWGLTCSTLHCTEPLGRFTRRVIYAQAAAAVSVGTYWAWETAAILPSAGAAVGSAARGAHTGRSGAGAYRVVKTQQHMYKQQSKVNSHNYFCRNPTSDFCNSLPRTVGARCSVVFGYF